MVKHCWTIIAAGYLCFGSAWASPLNTRYSVDVFGTVDGLPSSAVLTVIQARDGYLWLGTPQGLARFDGVNFTVFDANNTPGLQSSQIVSLFEDSQTNLWVGTENAGAALVHNGIVSHVDVGRVRAICQDTNGAVWVYNDRGELCRYRNKQGDVWNADSGQPGIFRGLAADVAGLLWVGAGPNLIALGPLPGIDVSGQKALPVAYQSTNNLRRLDFLLGSKRSGFWRMADFRIQKWNGDQLLSEWPYPWSNSVPVAACEDLQGNLVVGTHGDGVYWFDKQGQATRISTDEGLAHSSVLAVVVDREGCLWVGTNGGGLNRVKRQVFGTLDISLGKTVQSVCEDDQGGLWIGYNWDKIDYWSPTNSQQFGLLVPDPSVESYVKTVFVDNKRQVLAGTWNARGPHLFQLQAGWFQPLPLTRVTAGRWDVSAIYQDQAGISWFGTQGGLARWDQRGWKVFTTQDGLAANGVRAIVSDKEGNLWIGTDGGGLNCLRDAKFTCFTKTNALPSNDISSLYVDQEGVLWVGTAGGVARFSKGQWAAYSKKDGLISNSIGYIIEDGQGYLWLGSNAGLMRVHKKSFLAVAEKRDSLLACRAYGKTDGLPSSECTFGSQPGPARGREGKLYFPTTRGLATLDPEHLNPNTNPPPVLIEAVLLDGDLQHTNTLWTQPPRQVTVAAGTEALDIKYTSLNLAVPHKTRFRYRLEGHETAWTEAGWNLRVAHYTKVPPGTYRFQVAACNEDDVWNDAGAFLAVTVLPPFWRTWWFLSVMTVVALGMVVGSVYYASTQKLQRQLEGLRQQEALEKERARISRDLHDQLGANLTQVALLGELAETDKDNPQEVEAHARQIAHTARDTTRALDEIVWTVNPSNDTVDGLVNYLCKYAQEYFAIAGLRYRLDVPTDLPGTRISPELRHNVFLAAKEAVNNVVKHAQANAAWLRLRLQPGRFTVEIEDNGRGIGAVDEKTLRNGLRNMRRRMQDINGDFQIGPGKEGGTLVQLSVPLADSGV